MKNKKTQGKILFHDFDRKINRNQKIVFFLVVGLFLVLVVLVVVLVAGRVGGAVVASHYCDYQEESHQNHHQDHQNQNQPYNEEKYYFMISTYFSIDFLSDVFFVSWLLFWSPSCLNSCGRLLGKKSIKFRPNPSEGVRVMTKKSKI